MNLIDATLKELRERRGHITDALADRAAKDFAEYQFMCGEVRGLTAVESYLTDLIKRMEQSDD